MLSNRGLAFSTYAWPVIMRYVWKAVKVQRREQGHARVAKEAVGVTAGPVETAVNEAVYRALYRRQGLPERLRDVGSWPAMGWGLHRQRYTGRSAPAWA